MKKLDKLANSLIHWTWTKALLYWVVISTGTMAECAFLLASLWMCLNASVHNLMLAFMSESMTIRLTEISTAGYVALPECIAPLACVTTYNHIRTWQRAKSKDSIMWAVLYGGPTIIFVALSLFTLGSAVASIDFQLPVWMKVIRALAGFLFAFTSLLYWQIGHEQEADRLRTRDDEIAKLKAKLEAMHMQFETEVLELTDRLKERDTQVNRLAERASSLLAQDLALYPKIQSEWIEKGKRTASMDELIEVTGLTRQRIQAAIKKGALQKSSRNKDLITVSSIIEWLKTLDYVPSSNGHVDGDTDPLGLPVMNVEIA